jgi:hypothetical protein
VDDNDTIDQQHIPGTNEVGLNAETPSPSEHSSQTRMLPQHLFGASNPISDLRSDDGEIASVLGDEAVRSSDESANKSADEASDQTEGSEEDDAATDQYQTDRSGDSDNSDGSAGASESEEGDESDQDERDDGSNEENDETLCDYDSDSNYDALYRTATNRRHLTDEDVLWMIGLGSLNGHQLASSPYLRQLFTHRRISTQISMLKTVLGAGAMDDDTYQGSRDEDLLGDLLGDINTLFSGPEIKRRPFMRQQAGRQINMALSYMSSARVTDRFRWHCFRKALTLRSRSVCNDLLCASAFDFCGDEWSNLEDDAKRASEAYYTPRRVRRFLGRNFDGL